MEQSKNLYHKMETISFQLYNSVEKCSAEKIEFIRQNIEKYQDQRVINLSKKNLQIIFSLKENELVGFIIFDTDYDTRQRNHTAFINFAFVVSSYRDSKIFTQMLIFLENYAKELNFSALAIEVNRNNICFLEILNKKSFNLIFYRTWKSLILHYRNPISPEVIVSKNISEVFSFFLRETADLIDLGFASPITTWKDNNCESIYIERHNEIVACIVYSTEYADTEKYLFIQMAAVKKSYRRQGLHKILHSAFEQIAKEKGCLYISGFVNKKNLIRLHSCKNVEFEAQYHFMGKAI